MQDAHSDPFLMPECEVSYYPKTDTHYFQVFSVYVQQGRLDKSQLCKLQMHSIKSLSLVFMYTIVEILLSLSMQISWLQQVFVRTPIKLHIL